MLRPEYPGDEEFHRSVTELLEISAAARRPGYEAVISQVHAYLNEVRQAGT
jgi:hypothetical protein